MSPVPASAAPTLLDALEHEVKYIVPAATAPALRTWLSSVCRPNRALPPALVHTVYYDTPELSLLREKIDSDYLKTKVRVRWYSPLGSGERGDADPVFAEVKYRVGNSRRKARVRLDAERRDVLAQPLDSAAWMTLLAPLHREVPGLPQPLAPVFALTYARYRFVDSAAAAHVTVDEGIRVTATNTARLTYHGVDAPGVAVLEWKGHAPDLPPHLAPAVRFGARRASFSKYLACYQLVTRLVL